MHNKITRNKELSSTRLTHWFDWYLSEQGIVYYTINSFLYINTLKYIKVYKQLIYRLE